jgi:glycogen(starch) synthase
VGGIYTVIKTKTPVTTAEYGDRYCLIGPLNHRTASMEVETIEQPKSVAVAKALESLKNAGIYFMYGRWLIEGSPQVLLLDIGSASHHMNEWKSDLWNVAQIPSPPDDRETNDAIIFGYLVAWFLEEVRRHVNLQQKIIAHFHEWLAGVGLILLRKRNADIVTIFTTHATLLGRYLCAGDVDFYNNLKHFDVDSEAGRRGIYHRYCVERGAAHCADVFTTVSHITAFEAEHLLKRRPGKFLFSTDLDRWCSS